jgi:membrane protease YdiL (CAAX protease family)
MTPTGSAPFEQGEPGTAGTILQPGKQPELIAAPWHTVAVLLILLGIAAVSAWSASRLPAQSSGRYWRVGNYVTVFVWEWLTVAFIAWGVRKRGGISGLIGGSWPSARAILRDLGVAVLFLFGSGILLGALQFAMRATPNRAVRDLLPQTALETASWLLLSATAGFCEETIFRGYLQQQLSILSRSTAAGLVLQGALFGVCHGYQGVKSVVTLSVYGCLFGLLAQRRRSLRPGMLAHFLQDGVGGVVLREALKRLPSGAF